MSADNDTYAVSSVNNAQYMGLTSVTSMNSTIQHLYCLLYSSAAAHYKNISCPNKQQQQPGRQAIISQISPASMLLNILVNILDT